MDKNIAILGMGNPLLDMAATVQEDLLVKYNLKPNDAILYEEEDIFEDLLTYKVDYIAGGSTQNSIRVAQWILGGPEAKEKVAYFGAVGADEAAETLAKVAKEGGVLVKYQKKSDLPTGKCAVLITGSSRSLVTKLGAANLFTVDHLQVPENWSLVENSKVIYSSFFFLTVCPDAMIKAGAHASETGKHFAINLAAPFLSKCFMKPMLEVLSYASIVFGNETEAAAFGEENNYMTKDLKEIAKKISKLPLVGHRSRIVVITQGPDEVILLDDTGEIRTFACTELSADRMVDTNGAGDAFVGGFLAQLSRGESLEECIRCGIWAATEIIQRSGCTCPMDKVYGGQK